MPVFLLTVHAYGTWPEDHPRGYVQRGQGLRPPSPELRKAREQSMRHPAAHWSAPVQALIRPAAEPALAAHAAQLHALATTPTHTHLLVAFDAPAHTCPQDHEHCPRGCPAHDHARRLTARLKKDLGYILARAADTRGRPWLSRGWDLTAVRTRDHYDHLVHTYLPAHTQQHGTFWRRNP